MTDIPLPSRPIANCIHGSTGFPFHPRAENTMQTTCSHVFFTMAISFFVLSVYSPRPLVYVTEQDVVLVDGYPLQYAVQGQELTIALIYVIGNINNPLCSAGVQSSHGQPLSSGSSSCLPCYNASLSAGCVHVDEYNELLYTFTTPYRRT